MEKYFKFDGTATRSEYWGVNVIGGLIAFVLYMIAVAIGGAFGSFLFFATFLAALYISLAAAVRRCKNADVNPWWAAAIIVPFIGSIVLIVLGILKTDEGTK